VELKKQLPLVKQQLLLHNKQLCYEIFVKADGEGVLGDREYGV
jgi:hypothetical protein